MSDYLENEEDKKEAKKYCDRLDSLASKRTNWESHWQECMDFIVPRKGTVTTTRSPGDKRNNLLFDSTAIHANQLLASALHGMLTNPATRFFELTMGDPILDEDDEVKAWLQDVASRMFTVMNNSNFQTEIHEIYIDLGAIGTACMFMGENEESIVHFNARPIKEIFADENNLGLIDTVFRKFSWKPKQIVQEFGEDALPPSIREQYKNGKEEECEIIHAVHPMTDIEVKDTNNLKKFEYKSVYILKEENCFLSKSGFKEFPYAVPRWTKTTGEVYGRGPGMDMLPDIKMVDEMMRTTLIGAQKTINPPMMVSDDGVIGNVRLQAGGLTVVRPGGDAPIRPLIVDSRVDFGFQFIEKIKNQIRSGFFVDQLQLNEGPQMTATEVAQRTEEKLRLMGPVLGRQHFEFLRPVIDRVFGIMLRKGLFPPAPSKIQGKDFVVRYSSLVARAQRMSEGQNMSRAISVAAPIAQADPKSMDLINGDEAMKYILSDVYGLPHKLIRTERELKEIREARAKAQAQAAKEQAEMHQADVASKVLPGAAQIQTAQNQQVQ